MKKDRLEKIFEMLQSDPKDSFLRYALAKEFESLSDYKMALDHFLVLKANDPDYVGLYYHLAKLYEKLDNQELALQTYDEGIIVSKKLKDFHALSELNSARLNLEMDL